MRVIFTILFLALTIILLSLPVDEAVVAQAATNWFQLKTNDMGRQLTTTQHLEQGVWLCQFSGGGFVLVSGDNAAYPVIAWSETGDFRPSENPAVEDWLASIQRQMRMIATQKTSNATMRPIWDDLLAGIEPGGRIDRNVEPMITSIWRQHWPYNAHCPEDEAGTGGHVLVGCCATAAAQLMRYWEHPVNGVGSHSYEHGNYGTISADFSEATYVWSEMPDSLTEYNEEVAEICFHAGVAMDMDYGTSASGSNSESVYYAFATHFSYNPQAQLMPRHSFEDDVWDEMVRGELDQGRPVYYLGTEEDGGGHAFVIDGYEDTDHFHVNWGWGGACNGYYYFSNLAPGSHDYTYEQVAIFDLYPVEPNELAPATNLVAEVVDGNNVHLTWTPPVNDEGVWYSYADEVSLIQFAGPERAILFSDDTFDFSYPATILQMQHMFYDHVSNPWGNNDQFIVKIYDADFETVLYESSPQTALRSPVSTIHIMETPLTVNDDFYITIRTVDEVTFCPSSTSGECVDNSHSWWGGSGTWEQIDSEWLTSVNISDLATGRQHVLKSGQSRNRMFLGYNLLRNGTVINPLWLVDPEYMDENLEAGEYTYAVIAVYDNGESNPSNAETVEIGMDAGEDDVPCSEFSLEAYPNPFNPTTRISFSLPVACDVTLEVFNLKGQLVRTLIDEKMPGGNHAVTWSGEDFNGNHVASGVYLYRIKGGRYVSVKKMVMLK